LREGTGNREQGTGNREQGTEKHLLKKPMGMIARITANCHQTRNMNPTPNPLQYQKFILFFPPQRGD
jgi:hypothetical protein